jgi:hypothetical protein
MIDKTMEREPDPLGLSRVSLSSYTHKKTITLSFGYSLGPPATYPGHALKDGMKIH